MQRNHIIVLGSLGVLAGLAWYQRKSAGEQAASVTALGQKSNDNIAASILGSLAPMPSQYSTKAQTASVVDSAPYVPIAAQVPMPTAPFNQPSTNTAPLNEFNIWQVAAKPVSANSGGGGFAMVGA